MRTERDIKRIDCVGNANNYVLLIAEALRSLGIDAHIHLTTGNTRDQPEMLHPEYAAAYPEWIHDWRLNKEEMNLRSATETERELQAALSPADGLVLNYDGVALGALWARPFVCTLTGTDLYEFSTAQALKNSYYAQQANLFRYDNRQYQNLLVRTLRQRAAIRNACAFTFFPRGLLPKADAILQDIGVREDRRISLLLTDTNTQKYSPQPFRTEMHILYGARLSWDIGAGDCYELDNKGTDIFLRAFARFIRDGGQARLRLFRVGARVAEAEALTRELRIEDRIDWSDPLPQHAFNAALGDADLVVDQTGTSHIGMAVVDAMAKGRPVLAKGPDPALWKLPEEVPLCNAATEDEICAWLHRLSQDMPLRERIGQAARLFVEKYCSTRIAAEKILDALRHAEQPDQEIWLWRQYEYTQMREEAFAAQARQHIAAGILHDTK